MLLAMGIEYDVINSPFFAMKTAEKTDKITEYFAKVRGLWDDKKGKKTWRNKR